MYIDGNIIYFDPFYFKNSAAAKRKYFIVLYSTDMDAILASLPSSVPHLPYDLPVTHGCINLPESGISCYVINKNIPIATNNWSFKEDTFLYGNWIDLFDLKILRDTYRVEGIEYEIIGRLKNEELASIKACFRNSPIVKNKFKRLLS